MKVAKYQPKPDGMRCSPVCVIDGREEWCNAGWGTHGHLGAKEGMPYCSACGQEIGNEKVIE